MEKTKIDLEKTKANVIVLSTKLNSILFRCYSKNLIQSESKNLFLINLATEKELTEIKIRAGNLSIEIKSKTDVDFLLKYWIQIMFFYCVANSLRLGHEIKLADDNLKKELRGKIHF